MLMPYGVGFYSYMVHKVFGDTSISINEVIGPRLNTNKFFISLIVCNKLCFIP